MALSKANALVAARDIMLGQRPLEAERLNRLHAAVTPDWRHSTDQRVGPGYWPSVQIPPDAPPIMKHLARKAETNYLRLLVKTFRQVIKVEGYFGASDQGATDPWAWWQRNKMDSRQAGLVDSTLTYGTAYASAFPGTYGRNQPGPQISLYSPREMTALYQDPEADEWPMLALGSDGYLVRLYDEEMVYTFGVERGPFPYSQSEPSSSLAYGPGLLTFISADAHEVGVCPVVRYRDRNLLAGEESLGIVEPLLTVSERITESTFQALVSDYFQAFKQRYLIGWVPESEAEELKSGAGTMWYLEKDPADIKIGELDAGKVNLDMRNAAIRDFAAIGQIPAQALGIDGISNISDATLAGLERSKNLEVGEIATSLGESHEQLMRLCSFIDGNQAAADDYESEIRWRDFETRSYAALIDGLVKQVQSLGLDQEIALESVPGMTKQQIERNRAANRAARGRQTLDRLTGRGAPGATPPQVTDAEPTAP